MQALRDVIGDRPCDTPKGSDVTAYDFTVRYSVVDHMTNTVQIGIANWNLIFGSME